MTPTDFDKFVKGSIGFALASDLNDVPELPGIYAWYLPLKGDTSSDLLHYLKSLQGRLESAVPATEMSAAGQQRHFSVSRNPPSFDLAAPPVQRLAETITSSQLQGLASLILALSFLSEPIYVGMTAANKGLRSRLGQHLQSVKSFDGDHNWRGQFRTRIAKVLDDKTFLKQCVIAYMPISVSALGDDAPRVLEHILIRTVRPAQSVRG